MKIVDGFTFYNELKMLEFRLKELYNVVDYFIIVELSHTHAGNKKEFYFENNKNNFIEFKDKIIHVMVNDPPNTGNAWDNENYQRRCIDRGLQQLDLEMNDLIIISDCDEIPRPEILEKLKQSGIGNSILSLEMEMYYYNFECRQQELWYFAKILSYKKYKEINDPEIVRHTFCPIISKGGWHLSYFGDINFIKNKIKNFAHQEFNKEIFLQDDKIQNQIDNAEDLFFRMNKFKKVKIEDNNNLPNNYKLLL
jgi:beta-1,4-mannosyl-glycoprotein beta-1,4-N-acetylglucosaminyltransferase|tara:strand:- start:4 stop:759 length:756 start_codon:yes stop_codon:yes gene_type:complete